MSIDTARRLRKEARKTEREDINPEALAKLYDAIEIELRKRKEPAATGSIRKEMIKKSS